MNILLPLPLLLPCTDTVGAWGNHRFYHYHYSHYCPWLAFFFSGHLTRLPSSAPAPFPLLFTLCFGESIYEYKRIYAICYLYRIVIKLVENSVLE